MAGIKACFSTGGVGPRYPGARRCRFGGCRSSLRLASSATALYSLALVQRSSGSCTIASAGQFCERLPVHLDVLQVRRPRVRARHASLTTPRLHLLARRRRGRRAARPAVDVCARWYASAPRQLSREQTCRATPPCCSTMASRVEASCASTARSACALHSACKAEAPAMTCRRAIICCRSRVERTPGLSTASRPEMRSRSSSDRTARDRKPRSPTRRRHCRCRCRSRLSASSATSTDRRCASGLPRQVFGEVAQQPRR